jgi:hypothetical protein
MENRKSTEKDFSSAGLIQHTQLEQAKISQVGTRSDPCSPPMEGGQYLSEKDELEAILLLNLNQTQAKFSNQYKGLLFTFAGRLRGAQRARKMQQSHGRISTQTFNSSINYSQKQILTK